MSHPLRIAVFLGTFPVVSETFILRQITGLLDRGHSVDIFADVRPCHGEPIQPEVADYRLLDRTTYMDMPEASAPWELPVWPVLGQTWVPGASTPISNASRMLGALPVFLRCLAGAPRLALAALNRAEYGFKAASLSVLYRLGRLADRPGQYDVLHAHFGPNGNSFRFAGELWRAPMVVSFHGYDFSTLPRKEGRAMYDRLFRTAALVTVNSGFTRSRLVELGCPETKLRTLPVGLDLAGFPMRERVLEPGEPARLLTVARLTEIKGHEYILRAIARLRRSVPYLRYDVVGDGPLRKRLESLAGDLKLNEVVFFHGACAGKKVKEFLAEAHLFLLCSVSIEGDQEGQGLALQEAQACGLPVVATRHGALPEGMLDGRSGLLVPERDEAALAAAIERLIGDAKAWGAMGRAGRAFVEEKFHINNLNAQLVEIYREAMRERGPQKGTLERNEPNV